MPVPVHPKIYHIVHVDRLPSIIADGHLWCDAEVMRRASPGTTIGMNHIKQRRLRSSLTSHPGLHVGACVPFYFCPRSVMLYVLDKADDPDLAYQGGQGPIVHLEFDLHAAVAWADQHSRRWAFTLSNAGSRYFTDRCNLAQLGELDWNAIQATDWRSRKEAKQAEFLVEERFPWALVERVGVSGKPAYQLAANALSSSERRPRLEIVPEWYY